MCGHHHRTDHILVTAAHKMEACRLRYIDLRRQKLALAEQAKAVNADLKTAAEELLHAMKEEGVSELELEDKMLRIQESLKEGKK